MCIKFLTLDLKYRNVLQNNASNNVVIKFIFEQKEKLDSKPTDLLLCLHKITLTINSI